MARSASVAPAAIITQLVRAAAALAEESDETANPKASTNQSSEYAESNISDLKLQITTLSEKIDIIVNFLALCSEDELNSDHLLKDDKAPDSFKTYATQTSLSSGNLSCQYDGGAE